MSLAVKFGLDAVRHHLELGSVGASWKGRTCQGSHSPIIMCWLREESGVGSG